MPRPHTHRDFKDENGAPEPFSGSKPGTDLGKVQSPPPTLESTGTSLAGDKWSLPYQIFNTALKGTPPFTLLLSKCQGFGAPLLLRHQARVSSTAGQHHLVNNSSLQLGVPVCAPPHHLSLSGEQTDSSLPATAGPSVSPSAQHTSTDKAHVSCMPSSRVRQGSKDVHSGPHQALCPTDPGPASSDTCALPIRPAAG